MLVTFLKCYRLPQSPAVFNGSKYCNFIAAHCKNATSVNVGNVSELLPTSAIPSCIQGLNVVTSLLRGVVRV